MIETTIAAVQNGTTIAEIAGIVDNNSAISEETAVISEEQKNQAEAMVELIGKFKI